MDYFRHLRNRLHFPTMQYYCRSLELPTAQGWDKLEEKLIDACDGHPEIEREISRRLKQIFKETIPLGNRVVRVFQLDERSTQRVARFLSGLQPEDCPYTDAYPAPLSSRQLNNVDAGSFLVDVKRSDESVSLVFCGKRLVEEREHRSISTLGDLAVQNFGWQEYEDLILIRRRQLQAYEIVRLDTETGLLEIRVEDHSGLDSGVGLNEVQTRLNQLLANQFNGAINLIDPINLFPAIHPIYDDGDEGIVVELGFTTQTGSAKHEKMRLRAEDLREELFHVGGKRAIRGALTPFRIAVRWTADDEHGQEEVILPGSIRQLGTDTPWLDHMIVKGPVTEAHMRECIDRVVSHIPSDDDD